MIETVLEEAPEKLFDIANNLEYIHTEFHHVENMLSVYQEQMESEIEFIGESKDGYVRHFISRYDALRSIIAVANTNLFEATKAMLPQIDAIMRQAGHR